MPNSKRKFGRIVSKHKALSAIFLVVATILAIYTSLVLASQSYDRSDPRAKPNSYHSVEEVVIDRPVEDVFRFIQYDIPAVYTRLSPMHEKFEIVNAGALTVGAEIDCVEGDDREIVRNRYVVTEVIENRRIAMSSTPTRVYNRDTGKLTTEVNVYDYFDFVPLGPNRTRLTQTVVLDMKNPFIKALIDIIAFLTGTRDDWEQQFREQNKNLAAFAEDAL
jgi:hypothetical protein